MVEASHDAYVAEFGLRHERKITLSPQGLMVTGADRLVPVTARRGRAGFRRPLSHPSRCAGCRGWKAAASCSSCPMAKAGASAPAAASWRWRKASIWAARPCGGPSSWWSTGQVRDTPVEAAWVFEQIVRHSRSGKFAGLFRLSRVAAWQTRRQISQLSGAFMVEFTLPKNCQGQEGQGLAGRDGRQRQEAEALQGIQSLSLRSGQRRQSGDRHLYGRSGQLRPDGSGRADQDQERDRSHPGLPPFLPRRRVRLLRHEHRRAATRWPAPRRSATVRARSRSIPCRTCRW